MKKTLKSIFLSFILICSSLMLYACGPEPNKFDVSVNVWYSNYGLASGTGTYNEDENVTISAEPKNNAKFIAWMKDNIIVSYEDNYTFKISQQTAGNYTAIFSCPDLELVVLEKVEYIDNYDENTEITAVSMDLGLGNSYNNPKTILHSEIDRTKTIYEEFANTVAFDNRNPIYATLKMSYTYTIYENEEPVSATISKTSYLEINITKENLISNEIEVEVPTSLNGTSTIKFTFKLLSAPVVEETPESEETVE